MVTFLHDLTQTIDKYNLNFDAFSLGQLQSKSWLIDELNKLNAVLGTVFVLCGWYGLLPAMMFHEGISVEKIRSFDIDEDCWRIADDMNKSNMGSWKFKAIQEDINNINFEGHSWQMWSNTNNRMSYPITDVPDTIINTSCEHTNDDWFQKIPQGKMVIIQSNDFWGGEHHVNCCFDIDDFNRKYPLLDQMYIGERAMQKYIRFMKIGIK
jgi:hypothetical protein